jgi:hypothetical protein
MCYREISICTCDESIGSKSFRPGHVKVGIGNWLDDFRRN